MVALIKALQVILALSILIFIHELGHFTWAKIFGIRVEKFYLFFDVGGRRLCRWKWGETEFGIGWLPLGGYCKIAGMVDESLDTEQLKNEPRPWEFRSKPAWQRILVLFGGVLNNFIFAIAAYCVILGLWGQSYISNDESEIYASDLALDMGFRTGDRILALDDFVPENFGMIQADLARRNVGKVTVLRDADTLDIYIDKARLGEVMNCPSLFDLAIPFVIDSVTPGSPNLLLRKGDRIVRLDSVSVAYLQDARNVLSDLAGENVPSVVMRGADSIAMHLQVDTAGMLGVIARIPSVRTRSYTALESVPAGLKYSWEVVTGYIRDLRLVFTPSTGAYKSVGSFIAIGQVMPASWDWLRFVNILALLSIMLGVMNLIPIPGLDGGHILITLWELVTGRKPSDRFLYVTQLIGMALLIALMVLAFGNDIGRLIH